MTTNKDALRARMTAAAARRADPEAGPAGQTALRSKPVRVTLNIPPQLYRQLVIWADEVSVDLDVPRVPVQDALRAMIQVITSSQAATDQAKTELRELLAG